jgi:SAM-dependent methyltransferase
VKNFLEAHTLHQEHTWFSDWFDSPYYPILYKNRDVHEASIFIDKLIEYLNILPQHNILDIACGRGRHSIYMNEKGLNVVGIDLSQESISQARLSENERLHFFVHDMRELFKEDEFDFALNLFTSFGYFENEVENLQSIQAMSKALKRGGKLVIDFFNPKKVIREMLPFEQKNIEGIEFMIHKELTDSFIIKSIDFQDNGKDFHFQEKVKMIDITEFEYYFQQSDLKLIQLFGNYQLEAYNEEVSERMILIGERE